jgi:ribosomal-protein-alanine N-acetyltransferase
MNSDLRKNAPLVLESQRLYLVASHSAIAEECSNYLIRNMTFFAAWTPTVKRSAISLANCILRMDIEREAFYAKKSLKLWTLDKTDTGKIIGDLEFSHIIYGGFKSCFLGYKQDEKRQGEGLMTEAIKTAVDYIFTNWNLHRIEANIMPRNIASQRVIEKCGFEKEGYARQYLQIAGKWEDHEHWTLINERM